MSRYCSKFCYLKGGPVTLNENFRGKGASPTNDFWHQKSRVPELSYGKKKLPKSSTAWVGCTNVTDRQTDDRQQTTDNRQTTDGRLITYSERNVVRSLKTSKSIFYWQIHTFVPSLIKLHYLLENNISYYMYSMHSSFNNNNAYISSLVF